MKTRRGKYNYGYASRYGSDPLPDVVPTRTLSREPGFLSEAQKATLGPLRRKLVQQLEDRRRFEMAYLQGLQLAAKGIAKASAEVVERTTPTRPPRSNPDLGFRVPQDVSICAKRSQRREVLLAQGKGGGNHRPPRRNKWSDVKC